MATYVTLASLTDQGVRTIKDLSRRLQNAEQTFRSMGAFDRAETLKLVEGLP